LDTWTPVSLSAGSPATASASEGADRQPAPTPPATSGATVDKSTHQAGGRITITAGGFQPHETGILVVLYSDPVVLARNATADSNGVVTWSGTLPRSVTGSHTLTLQGSVSAGVPISITATTAAGCTIEDATLTWGF